jgi:hypothetical protein
MPALSPTEIFNLLNLTVSGIVAFITLILKAVHVILKKLLKRMTRIKSLTITIKISMPRIYCRSNIVEKCINLPVNFFIPLSASDRVILLLITRPFSSIRDFFSAEYHILSEYTSICLAVDHDIITINDLSIS